MADQECGKCNKLLRDGKDLAIYCDSCEGWFHAKCLNLTKKLVEAAEVLVKANLKWFCDPCCTMLLGLKAQSKKARSAHFTNQNSTEDLLEKVKEELKYVHNSIINNIQTMGNELLSAMVGDCDQSGGSQDSSDEDKGIDGEGFQAVTYKKHRKIPLIEEMRGIKTQLQKCKSHPAEDQDKDKGIVIFGVPECQADGSDRDMMGEILGKLDCNVAIKDHCRLGKLAIGKDVRPRPIKLVLNTVADKWKVLKESHKLKQQDKGEGSLDFSKIFLSRLLTREEQEQHRELVKRKKEKNLLYPHQQWVIRKGEVVLKD